MTTHMLGQALTKTQQDIVKRLKVGSPMALMIKRLRALQAAGMPVITGEPKTKPKPADWNFRSVPTERHGWKHGI